MNSTDVRFEASRFSDQSGYYLRAIWPDEYVLYVQPSFSSEAELASWLDKERVAWLEAHPRRRMFA